MGLRGNQEELYIDNEEGHVLTPSMLDGWLTELETTVPGVKSNIIIEACHSGSFIDTPSSISHPGRVVITSSNALYDAYASLYGAHFTDNFIIKLGQGNNLSDSFTSVKTIVEELYASQNPWLDANGNGVPNETQDSVIAAQRGFQDDGSSGDNWPPFIADARLDSMINNRQGRFYADVRDDKGVSEVWAVIYPPDYTPPSADGEFNTEVQESIPLERWNGNAIDGDYYLDYAGFTLIGPYRIAIHARDRDGLHAQPVVFTVGDRVFLPTISR
ncbi:MAG: hypothetical protein AAF639_30190 [Chloroflexota bacterium]